MEEWSSPGVVLVDFHAGLKVLSRWSPSSIAQSRLLEPSPSGGVVCARGDEEVTCCRRRSDLRFVDGRQKEKLGKKNPVAQKGRKSKWYPWLFGIRLVILMAG